MYGGGTHSYEDVRDAVTAGRAQYWPGAQSAIVTQIEQFPTGKRALLFWLAGGDLAELRVMYPLIEAWGVTKGCTHATMTGRPGWAKTWLTREAGWTQVPLSVYEKTLS